MNKSIFKILSLFGLIVLLGFAAACSDDEPPLPDNLVSFETTLIGLADDEDEIAVNLTLTRAVSTATTVQISFTPNGVAYGEDFTIEPTATGNTFSVTVPANATTASFIVARTAAELEGTESIDFEITNAGETGIIIGVTKSIKLSFSSIISDGSTLTLQGLAGAESGASAANSVFVDFSSNTQTSVLRTSWDLGFYTGDKFRVIINNTTAASAIVIDKTDINAVGSGDVNIDDIRIPAGTTGDASFTMIDDVYGNIDNTVIDEISATNDNNKVYVINRNGISTNPNPTIPVTITHENLIKVRVLRNANGGYTVQYAKLLETTFKSIEIAKTGNGNFNYVSFGQDGATATNVSVEQKSWDLQWSWSMYYGYTPTGEDTYPYGYSDVVFINHLGGVKAAEILTSTVTYGAYSEANVTSTTFLAERNVIGSTWRATTGTIGVFSDRFYVIQDAAGNVYKLKFNSFHASDGGTRGRPVIQYALVKKAN